MVSTTYTNQSGRTTNRFYLQLVFLYHILQMAVSPKATPSVTMSIKNSDMRKVVQKDISEWDRLNGGYFETIIPLLRNISEENMLDFRSDLHDLVKVYAFESKASVKRLRSDLRLRLDYKEKDCEVVDFPKKNTDGFKLKSIKKENKDDTAKPKQHGYQRHLYSPYPSSDRNAHTPCSSSQRSTYSPRPSSQSSAYSPRPSSQASAYTRSGYTPAPEFQRSGYTPAPGFQRTGYTPDPGYQRTGYTPAPEFPPDALEFQRTGNIPSSGHQRTGYTPAPGYQRTDYTPAPGFQRTNNLCNLTINNPAPKYPWSNQYYGQENVQHLTDKNQQSQGTTPRQVLEDISNSHREMDLIHPLTNSENTNMIFNEPQNLSNRRALIDMKKNSSTVTQLSVESETHIETANDQTSDQPK